MPNIPKPLPSLAVLTSTFKYVPETGRLLNLTSRTSRKAGEYADATILSCGYRTVYVEGEHYYAHRAVWALVKGYDTKNFIDHRNKDGGDNRIENLRECTHGMNMMNRSRPVHNTSGVKGVTFRKDNQKWRAYVSKNRVRYSLGDFSDKALAEAAVAKERARLHGDFARD